MENKNNRLEQLEEIFKYTETGIISCDIRGKIIRSNDAANLMFRRQLIGKNISDLVPPNIKGKHPDLITSFVNLDEKAKSMKQRSHVGGVDSNGQDLRLRISLVKTTNDNGDLEIFAIIENVTDLINVQEALRRAKSKRKLLRRILVTQKAVGKYFQLAGILITISFLWFAVTTQVSLDFGKDGIKLNASSRDSDQVEKLLNNIPTLLAGGGGLLAFLAGKKKEAIEIRKTHIIDDDDDDDDEEDL